MATTRIPILLIEDDPEIRELVMISFAREGWDVATAADGESGLASLAAKPPACIVLDIMLPGTDGLEVLRRLKAEPATRRIPIIMTTARGEDADVVAGLELGADDYVVKPFSPRELVERVKAILRRTRTPASRCGAVLTHGDLALDRDKAKVTLRGRTVALTPSEFRLLEALMSAPGRLFSRDQLLEKLNERGVVVDRVVDVHMGNLRQKIEPEPSNPRYILTARGLGYRFADVDE